VSDHMADNPPQAQGLSHEHTAVTTHLLRRRAGVPYEVERKVCTACRRVLDERPLRRAAA
jgi:hypothetical protein